MQKKEDILDISVWFYFAVACFGLAITPGPNAMLVMNHSVRFGPSVASYTVVGGVVAFVLLMIISMFGIDVLLEHYPHMLNYVKLAGGTYLIWLGVKQWKHRKDAIHAIPGHAGMSSRLGLFFQGAASAMSNPKVFLFFGAFLTQFINPDRGILGQFFIMAATFAFAEFFVEMSINLAAGKFRTYLVSHGQAFSIFCGSLFIIIGCVVIGAGF